MSLVAQRGEFLAVGHQRGAFAGVGALKAEHSVVGAGDQRSIVIWIRIVVLPDPDPREPYDGRFVVLRQCDPDAAALAVDAAAEADLVCRLLLEKKKPTIRPAADPSTPPRPSCTRAAPASPPPSRLASCGLAFAVSALRCLSASGSRRARFRPPPRWAPPRRAAASARGPAPRPAPRRAPASRLGQRSNRHPRWPGRIRRGVRPG